MIEELIESASQFLILNQPYRSKPIGCPNSEARLEQDTKILAYDRLQAAIKAMEQQHGN